MPPPPAPRPYQSDKILDVVAVLVALVLIVGWMGAVAYTMGNLNAKARADIRLSAAVECLAYQKAECRR